MLVLGAGTSTVIAEALKIHLGSYRMDDGVHNKKALCKILSIHRIELLWGWCVVRMAEVAIRIA